MEKARPQEWSMALTEDILGLYPEPEWSGVRQAATSPTAPTAPDPDADLKLRLWQALRLGMGCPEAEEDVRRWGAIGSNPSSEELRLMAGEAVRKLSRLLQDAKALEIVQKCELLVEDKAPPSTSACKGWGEYCGYLHLDREALQPLTPIDTWAAQPAHSTPPEQAQQPQPSASPLTRCVQEHARAASQDIASLTCPHHPLHWSHQRASALSMAAGAHPLVLQHLLEVARPSPADWCSDLCLPVVGRGPGCSGSPYEGVPDVVVVDRHSAEQVQREASRVSPLAAAALHGWTQNVKLLLDVADQWRVLYEQGATADQLARGSTFMDASAAAAGGTTGSGQGSASPLGPDAPPCWPDTLCVHRGLVFTPLSAAPLATNPHATSPALAMHMLQRHGAALPCRITALAPVKRGLYSGAKAPAGAPLAPPLPSVMGPSGAPLMVSQLCAAAEAVDGGFRRALGLAASTPALWLKGAMQPFEVYLGLIEVPAAEGTGTGGGQATGSSGGGVQERGGGQGWVGNASSSEPHAGVGKQTAVAAAAVPQAGEKGELLDEDDAGSEDDEGCTAGGEEEGIVPADQQGDRRRAPGEPQQERVRKQAEVGSSEAGGDDLDDTSTAAARAPSPFEGSVERAWAGLEGVATLHQMLAECGRGVPLQHGTAAMRRLTDHLLYAMHGVYSQFLLQVIKEQSTPAVVAPSGDLKGYTQDLQRRHLGIMLCLLRGSYMMWLECCNSGKLGKPAEGSLELQDGTPVTSAGMLVRIRTVQTIFLNTLVWAVLSSVQQDQAKRAKPLPPSSSGPLPVGSGALQDSGTGSTHPAAGGGGAGAPSGHNHPRSSPGGGMRQGCIPACGGFKEDSGSVTVLVDAAREATSRGPAGTSTPAAPAAGARGMAGPCWRLPASYSPGVPLPWSCTMMSPGREWSVAGSRAHADTHVAYFERAELPPLLVGLVCVQDWLRARGVLEAAIKRLPSAVLQALVAADDAMWQRYHVSATNGACAWQSMHGHDQALGHMLHTVSKKLQDEKPKLFASDYAHLITCMAQSGCCLGENLALWLSMDIGSSPQLSRVARAVQEAGSFPGIELRVLRRLVHKYPVEAAWLLCSLPLINEGSFPSEGARYSKHWYPHSEYSSFEQQRVRSSLHYKGARLAAAVASRYTEFSSGPRQADGEEDVPRGEREDTERQRREQGLAYDDPFARTAISRMHLHREGCESSTPSLDPTLWRTVLVGYMWQGPAAALLGLTYGALWTALLWAALGLRWLCGPLWAQVERAARLCWAAMGACCSEAIKWATLLVERHRAAHGTGHRVSHAKFNLHHGDEAHLLTVHCLPLPMDVVLDLPLLEALVESDVHPSAFGSPAVKAMVNLRWYGFTRRLLLYLLADHCIYMALFLVYALTLEDNNHVDGAEGADTADASGGAGPTWTACIQPTRTRTGLLSGIFVMTSTYLWQEVAQVYHNGWREVLKPWNVLDWVSLVLMWIVCINGWMGCRGSAALQRNVCAVQVLLLCLRLLYYSMASSRMGAFFRMVIEVVRDLYYFFIFLTVVFFGFAAAVIVLEPETGVHDFPSAVIKRFYNLLYGDFTFEDLTYDPETPSPLAYNPLSRVLAALFMIVVPIVLLNLIIAVIGDTFDRIKMNEELEAVRNRATIMLEVESVLPCHFQNWRDAQLYRGSATSWLYLLKQGDMHDGDDDGEDGADGAEEQRDRKGLVVVGNRKYYDGFEQGPWPSWRGRTRETKDFTNKRTEALKAELKHELAQLAKRQANMERRFQEARKQLAAHFEKLDTSIQSALRTAPRRLAQGGGGSTKVKALKVK